MKIRLLALALLAGCGSFKEARLADLSNPAPCPNVFVLDDAARRIDFAGEPGLDTVAWSAELLDVRSSCRYAEDSPIRAELEIDIAVGRGPAAAGETVDVTYFVAVTRTNRDLIGKEEFTVPVTIKEGGRAVVTLTEAVNGIVIPRANSNIAGTNFEIAVGFSLDREQLLFNRSGRSLKFPEL